MSNYTVDEVDKKFHRFRHAQIQADTNKQRHKNNNKAVYILCTLIGHIT